MFKVNDNFTLLPSSYLFSEVARRVRLYSEAHPDAEIPEALRNLAEDANPICVIVSK